MKTLRERDAILISIHALREEGDRNSVRRAAVRPNFYPRPPRGGRQRSSICTLVYLVFLSTPSARRATGQRMTVTFDDVRFLSTPSARRATKEHQHGRECNQISIHALREEGDLTTPILHPCISNFYPRPPRGGRLPMAEKQLYPVFISIHALREEGD